MSAIGNASEIQATILVWKR